MIRKLIGGTALLASVACAGNALAVDLLDWNGGYGQLAMFPNDDGSSNRLDLPFQVNFYGNNYNTFYANNNGNITFNGGVSTYTPYAFPISSQPMIAPYWGDVDTRGAGNVYVASPNSSTMAVTWNNVGYYSYGSNKTNDFQMLLLNRPDTGAGNFDIEFRYNRLQWTTGSASGGWNGLGGTPAQAGFDAGDGTHYLMLPGSRTADVLQLANTSNVSLNTPGLWRFAVRNGDLPGLTRDNPVMPTYVQNGWDFNFNVNLNQRRFVDPLLAVGYDFVANSGPNFQSVLLPNIGDGIFDIYGFDANGNPILLGNNVSYLSPFDFGIGGVNRFRIAGIETAAGLDPNDMSAFVTGLTWSDDGITDMTMTPLTRFVPDNEPVPEPSTFALIGLGLAGIAFARRRSEKK
jgi:hypothetical protein